MHSPTPHDIGLTIISSPPSINLSHCLLPYRYPPPAPSSPSRRERGKSREEDRDLDRERDRGSTRDDYHDDYLDGEAEGYYSDDVENPHNHTRERRDKRGDKHDVHERKEARKSTALEGSGGLVNLDRRGANRRQSLRMQAEAASPKDAHMMTVAAPKSNPLAGSGRRGSLLGKATANVGAGAGSYQAGVDRRRSRISDLATSAQRVSQRATPSPSAKSPMH